MQNLEDGHGKLTNGHEKVKGKYFVNSVGTLIPETILRTRM